MQNAMQVKPAESESRSGKLGKVAVRDEPGLASSCTENTWKYVFSYLNLIYCTHVNCFYS